MGVSLVTATKVGADGTESGTLLLDHGMQHLDLILVCALAVPFTWLTVRMRILTLGGALLAGVIALCVVATQGWLMLLPLFLFLLSGVLLGRLNKLARTDAKHGRPRDAMQVFCSGGIYAILAVYNDFHVHWWMSISICTAMCDTWASEIGMYFRWPTESIVTWRRVEPGFSGGISLPGTLGGLVGSMLLASVTHVLSLYPADHQGWLITIVSFAGIFLSSLFTTAFAMGGMLLDSVLGALLQVKYDDGEGPRDAGVRRISGLPWMTNDVVNLVSNALTVALAWWVLAL